jgi:predicted metalloendopeptidase
LIFKGFAKITPNTVITIRNNDYLKNLFLLIDKKGRRVANDYITWAVIKDLSRDTTPHMRNLNFLIDQAVLGVQDDLSREHECLNKIIEYFSPSLVPQYLNSYVNPKVFPKVTAMVASIKTAFIETLLRSDWLSKEAKLLSVEKVKNVKLYLGYSKWHLTGAPLRLYHKVRTHHESLS